MSAEERRLALAPLFAEYEAALAGPTTAGDDYPGEVEAARQRLAAATAALDAALERVPVPTEPGAPDRDYEMRVSAMAEALHEDCRLEWQAIAVVDPTRQITQHMADAHYGQAHDLVRRYAYPPASQPVPAPEPSARLREALDETLRRLHLWDHADCGRPVAECPDDWYRSRAALAATPQDPEA